MALPPLALRHADDALERPAEGRSRRIGRSPLDATGQRELHDALVALLGLWNRSGGTTLIVPGEYLEVVVTRA